MTTIARPVAQAAATEPVRNYVRDFLAEKDYADDVTTDAAIIANRRQTPQAVLDKRSAPRYTIEELNGMNVEALTARFNALPKRENKSAAVHLLDLVDLPRNAIANLITSVAMPRAREAAIARGDFDDAGLPKVFGSDILRGLGIKNRAVDAIAGFGLDVVTDPLSWIFAPAGGLKVVGEGAAHVTLGRTGQKVYRSAIKSVAKGREVANPVARKMVNDAIELAIEEGRLAPDASAAARAQEVAGTLAGRSGKIRDALGRIGVEQSGKGGELATRLGEQVRDVTPKARTVSEIESLVGKAPTRVEQLRANLDKSINEFIGKHTFNRPAAVAGVPLSAETGRAVAHVPFTDITFYAPFRENSGSQLMRQRAMALAQTGRVQEASSLWQATQHAAKIKTLTEEMQTLLREQDGLTKARNRMAAEAGFAPGPIPDDVRGFYPEALQYTDDMRRAREQQINQKMQEVRQATRNYTDARTNAREAADLAKLADMGDLIVTARAAKEASANVRLAEHVAKWEKDGNRVLARPTRLEIAEAQQTGRAIDQAAVQAANTIPPPEVIPPPKAPPPPPEGGLPFGPGRIMPSGPGGAGEAVTRGVTGPEPTVGAPELTVGGGVGEVTPATPVLSKASRQDDRISLGFDATESAPTAEQLKKMLLDRGYDVEVQRFATNVLSGSKGTINYRIDVAPKEGRHGSDIAADIYREITGTDDRVNNPTSFEVMGTPEQRFTAAVQTGLRSETSTAGPIGRTAEDLQRGVFGQIEEDALTGRQQSMFGDMRKEKPAPPPSTGNPEDDLIRDKFDPEATPLLEGMPTEADDDPFGFAEEAARFAEEDARGSQTASGGGLGDLHQPGEANLQPQADAGAGAGDVGPGADALPIESNTRVRRARFSAERVNRDIVDATRRDFPYALADAQELVAGIEDELGHKAHFSTSFSGPIPTELAEALGDRPHLRSKLKPNQGSRATGEDSLAQLGTDNYLRILEETNTAKATRAARAIEQAGEYAHPHLRMLAWLHNNPRPKGSRPRGVVFASSKAEAEKLAESLRSRKGLIVGEAEPMGNVLPAVPKALENDPEAAALHRTKFLDAESKKAASFGVHGITEPSKARYAVRVQGPIQGRVAYDVVPNPARYLAPGSTFEINGRPFEVVEDEGKLWLHGQDIVLDLSDLEHLPIDNGSLNQAGNLPDELATQLVPGHVPGARAEAPPPAAAAPPGPPPPPEPPIGTAFADDFDESRWYTDKIDREQRRVQTERERQIDPTTAVDDIAPTDDRLAQIHLMRDYLRGEQTARIRRVWQLADEDLPAAEKVAEAFEAVVESAYEVARLRQQPLREVLGAKERAIAAAAAYSLGESAQQVGVIPFVSTATALRQMGNDDESVIAAMASRLEKVGRGLAEGVGAGTRSGSNDLSRVRAMYASIYRGAEEFGAQFAKSYHDAIGRLAQTYKVENPDELHDLATAMIVARHQPEESAIWTLSAPAQRTPSAALVRLERARQSGLLKNEDLAAELQDLADQASELWGTYAVEAADESMLGRTVPGGRYIPSIATPEYRRALLGAHQKFTKGQTSRGAAIAGAGAEAFQKPRGMWQIRYQTTGAQEEAILRSAAAAAERSDVARERFIQRYGFAPSEVGEAIKQSPPEGRVRSFFEWERNVYGGLSEGDVQQMHLDPDVRSQLDEIRDSVGAFESIFPELKGDGAAVARTSAFGRPMDPFSINEYFENGIFQAITGVDIGKAAFQTDLTHIIADSMAATEMARSKREFLEYAGRYAVPFDRVLGGRIEAQTPGATARLSDGTVVTALGDDTWRIGSKRYRYLKKDLFKHAAVRPLDNLSESSIYGMLFPEEVAHHIEMFADALEPTRFKGILRVANDFTRYWKANVLFHPSWGISNTIGNVFLLAFAHRNPETWARMPELLRRSIRMATRVSDRNALVGQTVHLGGQAYDLADLLAYADANGITNGGRFAEAMDQWINGHAIRPLPDQRVGFVPGVQQRLKDRHARLMESSLSMAAAGDDPTKLKAAQINAGLRAAAGELGDGFRKVINTWYSINGKIDDTFRLASFMAHLDEGNDLASAVTATKKAMLSYGDFTKTENQYLRPLFPFYAWLKASFPNMTAKFFTDPEYFAVLPKLQQGMEQLFAGEDQVPRHLRPRWLQQQLAIQISTDPETRKAFTIGTILPQEQTLATIGGALGLVGQAMPGRQDFDGGDFMDALDFWFGQTAPPIKIATDLATGRESFTGRQIGQDLTEGDITMSEYLIGQIRWAKELGIGSVRSGPLIRSFREGVGTGLSRFAFGGRLQPLDEQSRQFSLRRELSERESRIRRAINVAEREGNERASLEARANLLREYQRHLESGGDPADVPKWAQKQLMELEVAR